MREHIVLPASYPMDKKCAGAVGVDQVPPSAVCTKTFHDIGHIFFGLLYVMFTFPTRIIYRGVPGFATDCPSGVWCRGLTTCSLYVGPLFGNLV